MAEICNRLDGIRLALELSAARVGALRLVEVSRRDHAAAFTFYEESLALARQAEDAMAISLIQGLGALVALGKDDHERVRGICEEVLGPSPRLGAAHTVVFALHLSAALADAQRQPIRAARLWGAAEALRESLGIVLSPVEAHHYGPYVAAARKRVDEEAWEAAWAEGKAMSLDEAVEYVLSWEERAPSPTRTGPGADRSPVLSRREREISALVARGLTNRRISEELAISERTVATYVGRCFRKLGLRSRAQLAAWATKRDSLP